MLLCVILQHKMHTFIVDEWNLQGHEDNISHFKEVYTYLKAVLYSFYNIFPGKCSLVCSNYQHRAQQGIKVKRLNIHHVLPSMN